MNAKQLRELADRLFTKRGRFISLCQEVAENFYVERADFTVSKQAGDEYAGNLMTSYPLQCRRDLGDQIQTMLRPTGKVWAHVGTGDPRREDTEAKQWFEEKENIMRRAMYDRKAMFEEATAMSDHDFATFGQCVMSVRLARTLDRLMYRNWHIRDVVWTDNDDGGLQFIARRWKPAARTLVQLFPKTVDPKIAKTAEKDPFTEYDCLHIVCEADMYDGKAGRFPYWSIYYDCTNNKVLEEVPTWNIEYAIPRWKRVSGSQYAYSPATVIALPDARLIQAITLTLLEAGEKAVNPPIIATQDAVRSDVALYAGGLTWIDYEYDEKTGEALRPMPIDTKGIPLGIDLQRDTRELISRAFFLNKLALPRPEQSGQMTAYETGQRIQEYIRGALPLFAPMETEYNGAICDLTWDLLFRNGAFGSPYDMPRSLRGAEIQFRFESPLHDLIEQAKGQKWLEAKAIVAD
ncbi:MAG TPA: portal protein, partial [Alphaproteobacteria bacterium]|nr:portal protein [Alphaproteobacteria bacterium]